MRKTVVQSLSLPTAVAEESKAVAKELGKTKSELFVEAIQAYLRLYRFRKLQAGFARARRGKRSVAGESEEQVNRLVHEYRREKKKA